MYLFGFPEGLAGGSKETSYITNFDTSHTTSASTSEPVLIGNTSWQTNWSTKRETNIKYHSFHNGMGVENLYKAGVTHVNVNNDGGVRFYALASEMRGTYGLYDRTPENGIPVAPKITAFVNLIYWQIGVSLPNSGADPSVNVGKHSIGSWYKALTIGTFMGTLSDGSWDYAITVSSLEVLKRPHEFYFVVNVNYPAPYLNGVTHTDNKSTWFATNRTTTADTYRTSSWDSDFVTTWGTDRLTSHITYG